MTKPKKVRGEKIKMPKFSREVLYADEEENPWTIGEAPDDIVEKVKTALSTQKAPVQVVYNHEGYWHSVFVVGYDDDVTIGKCPFIQESLAEFQKEADKSTDDARKGEEKSKNKSEKRAKKYLRYKRELERSVAKHGGCKTRGVFYVRDSQYSHSSEPIYRYDLKDRSGDKHYSKRIILREYDWLLNMANHVTVITAE